MTTIETIKARRTVRKFTQEKLPQELLIKCVDAARLAPTAANLQPIKYKIINDEKNVAQVFKHVKWAGYIAPEGNPKTGEEPTAYIAVLADLEIKKSGYEVDYGSQVSTMLLAAEELNIGACWIQSVDCVEVSSLLSLPENLKLLAVVAMGAKAEQPVYFDKTGDSIKYYKDENGVLNVPKRTLEEILV